MINWRLFASLHLAFVCAFLAVAYQKTYFFAVETIHNHHIIILFYFRGGALAQWQVPSTENDKSRVRELASPKN